LVKLKKFKNRIFQERFNDLERGGALSFVGMEGSRVILPESLKMIYV